jgi:hypothetical protein
MSKSEIAKNSKFVSITGANGLDVFAHHSVLLGELAQ